jgi:transposase-like protein
MNHKDKHSLLGDVMKASLLTATYLKNEDAARAFLERIRWPHGPVCPHCGATKIYRLNVKGTRRQVLKCAACRKQFSVTLGTIFEDSHIPLTTWIGAMTLLCSSKKGMSAHQLHRMMGITYKSAWFMAHRIRHAMSQSTFPDKLGGIVEADETYVGGKTKGIGMKEAMANKAPVFLTCPL